MNNDLLRKAIQIDENLRKLIESESEAQREITELKGKLLKARQALRDIHDVTHKACNPDYPADKIGAVLVIRKLAEEELKGERE